MSEEDVRQSIIAEEHLKLLSLVSMVSAGGGNDGDVVEILYFAICN